MSSDNCAAGCEAKGETCVCAATVRLEAVFSAMPTRDEAARLPIAMPRETLDDSYRRCSTPACSSSDGVSVYMPAGGSGAFDSETIFELSINGRRQYRANKVLLINNNMNGE